MDIEGYLRFLFALVFVLALIGALAWAAKRFGLGQTAPRLPGQPRRLAIVEAIALDTRRRLILVRRDNTEHLLLTGGPNDVAIETGIAPATPNPKAPAP